MLYSDRFHRRCYKKNCCKICKGETWSTHFASFHRKPTSFSVGTPSTLNLPRGQNGKRFAMTTRWPGWRLGRRTSRAPSSTSCWIQAPGSRYLCSQLGHMLLTPGCSGASSFGFSPVFRKTRAAPSIHRQWKSVWQLFWFHACNITPFYPSFNVCFSKIYHRHEKMWSGEGQFFSGGLSLSLSSFFSLWMRVKVPSSS